MIDQVLNKLLTPNPTAEQAQRLADLAYVEWLGSLPGDTNFHTAAMGAYARAHPMSAIAPAAAAFCDRLIAATGPMPMAFQLDLPARERRGGAQARRALY